MSAQDASGLPEVSDLSIRQRMSPPGYLWSAAVAADGQVLMAGEDDYVALWAEGAPVWRSTVSWPKRCGLTDDYAVVASRGGRADQLHALDRAGGEPRGVVALESYRLEALALSEDGAWAVTAASGGVPERTPQVVDLSALSFAGKSLKAHKMKWVNHMALSPSGARLATVAGGDLKVRPTKGRKTEQAMLCQGPVIFIDEDELLLWRPGQALSAAPLCRWPVGASEARWALDGPWPNHHLTDMAMIAGGRFAALSFNDAAGLLIVDVEIGAVVARHRLPDGDRLFWRIASAGPHLVLWQECVSGCPVYLMDVSAYAA